MWGGSNREADFGRSNNNTSRFMMCKRNMLDFLFNNNRHRQSIRCIADDQSGENFSDRRLGAAPQIPIVELKSGMYWLSHSVFAHKCNRQRNDMDRRSDYRLVLFFVLIAAAPCFSGGVFENESRQPSSRPECECCIRPQDQIWCISTRDLGPCGDKCSACAPQLRYSRFVQGQGWVGSNADEFFANDDSNRLTVAYVHGNRMTPAWTADHGFKVYCMLANRCCNRRSMRFVIWSWPSDPIRCELRIVKDARIKATRTAMQSNYLGWWLSQLEPSQQVGLIGYSYGSRTILGALHMLAGGTLDYRALPAARYGITVQPKVVLWATANQADWILPGNRYGCATQKISEALVTCNRWDPVLRRYRRIPESTGPALGFAGVVCPDCIPNADRICVMNVQSEIGHRHEFQRYVSSCRVAAETCRVALWN